MKSLPERIMEHAEATPRPRRRPRRSARRPCFTSAKRAAVGQALSRLARAGRLMRICDEGCGSLVPPRII